MLNMKQAIGFQQSAFSFQPRPQLGCRMRLGPHAVKKKQPGAAWVANVRGDLVLIRIQKNNYLNLGAHLCVRLVES